MGGKGEGEGVGKAGFGCLLKFYLTLSLYKQRSARRFRFSYLSVPPASIARRAIF